MLAICLVDRSGILFVVSITVRLLNRSYLLVHGNLSTKYFRLLCFPKQTEYIELLYAYWQELHRLLLIRQFV
jgi:hypothetical protein